MSPNELSIVMSRGNAGTSSTKTVHFMQVHGLFVVLFFNITPIDLRFELCLSQTFPVHSFMISLLLLLFFPLAEIFYLDLIVTVTTTVTTTARVSSSLRHHLHQLLPRRAHSFGYAHPTRASASRFRNTLFCD